MLDDSVRWCSAGWYDECAFSGCDCLWWCCNDGDGQWSNNTQRVEILIFNFSYICCQLYGTAKNFFQNRGMYDCIFPSCHLLNTFILSSQTPQPHQSWDNTLGAWISKECLHHCTQGFSNKVVHLYPQLELTYKHTRF